MGELNGKQTEEKYLAAGLSSWIQPLISTNHSQEPSQAIIRRIVSMLPVKPHPKNSHQTHIESAEEK